MVIDETKTCFAIGGGFTLILCAGLAQFWNKRNIKMADEFEKQASNPELEKRVKEEYIKKRKRKVRYIFMAQSAMIICVFFGIFIVVKYAGAGWDVVSGFIRGKEIAA